jgi:subtilisin family serine protease
MRLPALKVHASRLPRPASTGLYVVLPRMFYVVVPMGRLGMGPDPLNRKVHWQPPPETQEQGMGARVSGALGGRTSRLLAVAVLAVVLVAMLPPAAGAANTDGAGRPVSVIVQAEPAGLVAAARQVTQLGGQVGRRLGVINGFTARVPAGQVGRLQRSPAVSSVTENEPVAMQAAAYAPTTDAGSLYTTTLQTGAQAYWKAGFTGKGVDVAVIDTGTAPVSGLDGAGKIVNGPDLSFESQAPNLRYLDTYGHGTHMAGIIAGRAAGAVSGSYAGDTSNFLGMAPDARIVSVKVADAMGAADVSQIIAAIDWVVQNKTTGGLNIRVLNLSFGTNTTNPYSIDPLCHAVEAAWRKGITVVAATGNAGFYMTPGGPGLTSPARDPSC